MCVYKTTAAVSVAANCSLVSEVYKIPETACPTSSFECHKNCSKHVLKIINASDDHICIFGHSCFYYEVSKAEFHFSAASIKFAHPCANWW